MSGIKITALPAATSVQLTDVFPADQVPGPVTRKITIQQILDLFGGDFVLLNPTGPQIITSQDLTLQSGELFTSGNIQSTSGSLISGQSSGGSSGTLVLFPTTTSTGSLQMLSVPNAGNFTNTLRNVATSAARTWSLPDASGVIALTSNIPSLGDFTFTADTMSTATLNTNLSIVPNGLGITLIGGAVASTNQLANTCILDVAKSGSSGFFYLSSFVNAANNAPAFVFQKSRSTTVGVFSAVSNGDVLSYFNSSGDDGSSFDSATSMRSIIDGSVSVGIVPGRFEFYTQNTSGSLVKAMSISSAQIVSLTNPLGTSSGGTGASLTASNGGIVYSTASAMAILSGTATANQMLLSGASGPPAWSTVTHPATTTINQILYSSAANVISGLTTANSGVLITSAGGVPSISSTLPSGISATNMTLTTPALGVATATSISFGGSALSSYVQLGPWTPTFNFLTPGNLSVAYSSQSGTYTRIGNHITLSFILVCTPTFTTSSGQFYIGGLPVSISGAAGNYGSGAITVGNITFTAGKTQIISLIDPGFGTFIQLSMSGTGTAQASAQFTNFTTGVAVTIAGTCTYLA